MLQLTLVPIVDSVKDSSIIVTENNSEVKLLKVTLEPVQLP